jgi:hypothetical protein
LERCCRRQQQVVRLHSRVAQLAAIQAKQATAAERSEQLAIEQAAADAEQLTLERCGRRQQQVLRLHSSVAQLAAIPAKASDSS